jgi:hypothetical protein
MVFKLKIDQYLDIFWRPMLIKSLFSMKSRSKSAYTRQTTLNPTASWEQWHLLNHSLSNRVREFVGEPGCAAPSAKSKALYSKRKSTAATVFGIINQVLGFRQFLLRGLEQVKGEWSIVCMAWNLKRLHALKG